MFFVQCFIDKQKTAYELRISDWSPDVCSSDLVRRQQLAECLPNTFIVVHNEDDTIIRHHDAAFDSTGNVKMNFAPCGSFLSAHRRPPCNSTIERQIASPIPIPSRFVVTNGSNILSSDSIPPPRSLLSVCTTSPIRRVRIQSTFSPETESIASKALRMRLTRTCCI